MYSENKIYSEQRLRGEGIDVEDEGFNEKAHQGITCPGVTSPSGTGNRFSKEFPYIL